jgi:hypothetical protein
VTEGEDTDVADKSAAIDGEVIFKNDKV